MLTLSINVVLTLSINVVQYRNHTVSTSLTSNYLVFIVHIANIAMLYDVESTAERIKGFENVLTLILNTISSYIRIISNQVC